jgi:GTP cyclohydrolase I
MDTVGPDQHERRFTSGTAERRVPALQLENGAQPPGSIDRVWAELANVALLEALGVDLTKEDVVDAPPACRSHVGGPVDAAAAQPHHVRERRRLRRDGGRARHLVRVPYARHLLPFSGIAHVGYLRGQRTIGLSKPARVVTHFARNLQCRNASSDRWPTRSTMG